MKLPRFTATIGPPRESGLARAGDISALTRTGDTAVWRGVSQLGGAVQGAARTLFAVSQEKQKLDDDLQTARRTGFIKKHGQVLWDKIKTLEIQTDQQAVAVSKDATKFFNEAIQEQMKDASPGVRQNLELYAAEAVPAYGVESKRLATSLWKEFYLVEDAKIRKALLAEGRFEEADKRIDNLDSSGLITPAEAVVMRVNAEKMIHNIAVNNVHAQIEAGNFALAKELAKSSVIPETQQTALRTAVRTAETRFDKVTEDQRQRLINKTTSDSIREYFSGDLTVATLNERHEKGLIKDSEFKFMMKGLAQGMEDHSDPFAAGKIRRAKTDFDLGAITREQADKIILENYTKLDDADKSKVVADLEDVEAKIIATAKSNAYSEGRGLMSTAFVGIKGEDDLLNLLLGATGLTDEEKDRINRRWTVEVSNRDLYERAVDDRFKEMRREKVSDVDRYKAESLRVLLQYQKRKQLTLPELEEVVAKEQQKIISGQFGKRPDGTLKREGFLGVLKIPDGGVATEYSVGVKLESMGGRETDIPSLVPTLTQKEIDLMVNDIIPNKKPVPEAILQKAVDHANKRVRAGKSVFAQVGEQRNMITVTKPVNEMTTEEKQRELQRIRDLKRLAR